MIKIEHIAIWAKDLERIKNFYCKYFNGTSGNKYTSQAKGFSSYFVTFNSGSRLEIMHSIKLAEHEIAEHAPKLGIAHIAISLGNNAKVDALTKELENDGYTVLSQPRTTGDGYYESCDPENNQIEITG